MAVRLAQLLLLAGPCLLVAQQPPVPIGSVVAAPFTDVRWQSRRLQEFTGARALVVFFTKLDCPIVQRYLPRLQQLAQSQAAAGVQCLAVNSGEGDSLVDAAAQVVELAPSWAAAKDFDGALARACGVDRTATALVLDAERRIRYRGRVDGQYHYNGATPVRGRADLDEALAAVLAGTPVGVEFTEVEGCKLTLPAPAAPSGASFCSDIAPLLQQHCQECHRPGGVGPFALLSYTDARQHGAMLGEVVAQGRMPPWYGASKYGEFTNHRGLPAAAKATIATWLLAGMPEGDPARLPAPRQFPTAEWRIGEPDVVIKVPGSIKLPADGFLAYKYFVLPYRFEQDTWVEAIEIKPENRRALHHCNLARVKWGEKYQQEGFVTGQVPGGDAMLLDPGTAVKIPAGYVLALQAHYVTTGEPAEDRLRVGLRFPRVAVRQELLVQVAADFRFAIPPGGGAHPVAAARRFNDDAVGIGMFVHMHLRGRDMTITATAPDGGRETLLLVPNYNFDWQQSYRWAPDSKRFTAGTRLSVLAHYDNSPFNPFNPDAEATVRFGEATSDEMLYAFLFYVREHEQLGLQIDPKTGHVLAAGAT
ncbi:MAG TPA: redoxin family protein, partial [Planctomycetota bacterium]|nr:redoxin family protein [Planctomycetota bacterium]